MAAPDLDRLLGVLDYPMYIVTAASGGRRAGCLVGFGSQCSIDPVRWWIWLSVKNHTCRVALEAEHIAVHLPAAHQLDLARLFGEQTGDRVDKFAQCSWTVADDGVTPILGEVPRWFLGRIDERVDSGDHIGFVLEPVAARCDTDDVPLSFQVARGFDPGHDA